MGFNYEVAYKLQSLENSGSPSMNVDGSTSSVVFKYAIPAGEMWFLESINFFILDPGVMAHNSFGAITALTNGLKVVIKKAGNENNFKINNIKDNVDILKAFPFPKLSGSSATAFLNDEDYYMGSFEFRDAIRLTGDEGDLVKIVIQDDLTAIARLEADIIVKKVV